MHSSTNRNPDMAAKKPFVLRLDEGMMKALEKWGADEFRSTNGQLEWIIREALKKAGRLPKPKPEDKNSG